ncbi:hypothetical protein QFZ60_002388 [Arthrobacter sp. B2I5]|uniref:hypothetical protein n=1 Tax=Arthrobacter sp. B2I5 TaxID=3042266 RepID=UPI00278289F4|nr:hypothetical protein [Arthrobacter sp. B2I5]MDQ0826215.1 hypothetical protein [Arthrobacter sp. B2I5]
MEVVRNKGQRGVFTGPAGWLFTQWPSASPYGVVWAWDGCSHRDQWSPVDSPAKDTQLLGCRCGRETRGLPPEWSVLAGGLLSETLSTGIAIVLRSTPDYNLDINSALLLQGLWFTALAQGQVALGVVIIALSASSLLADGLPKWVAWFGIIAGIVTILRPLLLTQIPLFMISFQPDFLWIAIVSVLLLTADARKRPSVQTGTTTAAS